MIDKAFGAKLDGGRVREETRARLVAVATDLLAREGRDAVTTRAVVAAAGVQAPTLYRLFGDKRGLLDAVAEHGFRAYMAEKGARAPGEDPVDDLRRGWDLHVAFGLAKPAIYGLMYADPRPGGRSPVADRAFGHLRELMRRLAVAGWLRVGEDQAAELVHAAACGTVMTMLTAPGGRSDPGLPEAAREAVIAAIAAKAPMARENGAVVAAVALRARLPEVASLTQGERTLLGEWLDRLAAPP